MVRLSALHHGRLYLPENIPGTYFCYRLSRPQGRSAAGGLVQWKNPVTKTGNRTRHLPAFSAVPRPTTPPRAVLLHVSPVIHAQLGFGILSTEPRNESSMEFKSWPWRTQCNCPRFISFPLLAIIPPFLPAHLLWPRNLCGSPVQAAHYHIIVFELRPGYRVRHCRRVMYSYLLTPWSRILPERLKGSQLVKRFPAFYGTRRFITAFTSLRQ